jgi:cysteine peptidase C11 family protein
MPEVKELEEREPQLREWTVMFCFATDNPLAPGTISQLKAIKNAGFHRDVNVIAQFDPHTINMPVHIFDVNMVERLKLERDLKDEGGSLKDASNIGFAGNDPFVRNLVLDKLWDASIAQEIKESTEGKIDYNPPIPSVTMSSEENPKESLARLLDFCRKNYPARHYMLIILAHGVVVGNDLFMFDEHGSDVDAQQHALTLTELGDVLDRFKDQISKDEPRGELELIGFHSCSMSGAEVAFELRGKANYMMASQGPIYVGSWPYRQILIRLFNDMENGRRLSDGSIAAGLVNRLKTGVDEPATHLRRIFNGEGARLLQEHRIDDSPSVALVDALTEKIKSLINSSSLCDLKAFQNGNVSFSKETKSLKAKHKKSPLRGEALRDLNQKVLEDAFPEEMEKARIREMFIKMFEYTIYNSFDFQLAGYSADLTLCDLNRVHQLKQPMADLATALREGLALGSNDDLTIQNAVLLAHWEAQSYFDENFTDLYDFCFRLVQRYDPAQAKSPTTRAALKKIIDACDPVMNVLKRGALGDDFGPIVRCVFCGPDYQYSHGLSVFFPWAEPIGSNMWDEQYEHYELNQRTGWRSFLKIYFDKTMRETQRDEIELDERERHIRSLEPLSTELLGLLERMSAGVLSGIEQLAGKTGAGDPLGDKPIKTGAGDPTGGGSGCVVIKNYPHFTGLKARGLNGKATSRGRTGKPEILAAASGSLLNYVTNQMMQNGDSDT